MPNITKRFVDGATPGRWYDDKLAGFGLYVGATGARTYFFEYRPARGRAVAKRRISIGKHGSPWTPETARAQAHEYSIAVRQGRDPLDERAKRDAGPDHARLVEAVFQEWLRRDQAANRSCAEVERIMRREVLPWLGARDIAAVRKRDIIELVDSVMDRGAPILANRVLAHTKRMFRWAAGRDIIDVDPAAHIERPSPERARDRVLGDDELVSIWRASAQIGGPFGAGIRLLIATGARREEIFGLRWSEIDGNDLAPVVRLPAERSKVGEARVIPLSPLAMQVIEGLPRAGSFAVSTTGAVPFSNISKNKRALDDASGVRDWRIHDIRRTVATGLQRLGVRLEVIEAVLGHVSGTRAGVVGVYQRHKFEDEAREALKLWAAHIERQLSGHPGAEVVAFRIGGLHTLQATGRT
jgi:integrase